ncbi:MAG: bifunctional diaminohydroxyphosphoribosylaminopyrimidine deaminase/5-amino-6-(5-phosphoribosylamino)uracil reductase RibD [Alphaproteobacteria bacterium]|nr:bifunctional diaminohydroxyphosphoribosylaminopyrimidine deaminase/5-amino-6-(5-phosphoribosylamino)uracil reductase RibD [Alphaproteobacteria bacterium]
MDAALALARHRLGRTWPNPAVGCVIVKDGLVVARAATAAGGRPHAETQALDAAGAQARGATAYVSLEPCSHWGKTPPCADALVAAGIARAVVAVEDPDPRVVGQGIAKLRAAGIAVAIGMRADAAAEVNAGFFLRVTRGRPLVTLKLATSLDGRIAASGGDSKWVTGEEARARAHLLRASHDAIAIGTGTALADDPLLTCRLPGLEERSPLRIVFDSRLRLPPKAAMLAGKPASRPPTWIVTLPERETTPAAAALRAVGAEILPVPAGPDGRIDPAAALQALGARGLTRLLVEGGGELAAALVRGDLVDRIAWFRAPLLLGAEGRAGIGALAVAKVAQAPAFMPAEHMRCGKDVLETYRRTV